MQEKIQIQEVAWWSAKWVEWMEMRVWWAEVTWEKIRAEAFAERTLWKDLKTPDAMKSITSQLIENCSKTAKSTEFSNDFDHCHSSNNRKQILFVMLIFHCMYFFTSPISSPLSEHIRVKYSLLRQSLWKKQIMNFKGQYLHGKGFTSWDLKQALASYFHP